jgi:hypothetical protein
MRAPASSAPATRIALCGRLVAGAVLLGAACFGAALPAAGEDVRIESTSYRPPHRRAAEAPPDNRRLISPMGSAAGVTPGYYQRNMGWNGPPLEYAPVLTPAIPFVMYVGQPLFPPEPQSVTVINNVTVNTPPPVVERVVVREEPPPRRQAPPPRVEPEPPPAPKPTAPQPVVFQIVPKDAQVKLDGRKLGTAAELGSREAPFELEPGVYILQVEHPTYKSQRLVFGVSAERVRVDVDLTAEDASLRARVR